MLFIYRWGRRESENRRREAKEVFRDGPALHSLSIGSEKEKEGSGLGKEKKIGRGSPKSLTIRSSIILLAAKKEKREKRTSAKKQKGERGKTVPEKRRGSSLTEGASREGGGGGGHFRQLRAKLRRSEIASSSRELRGEGEKDVNSRRNMREKKKHGSI